MTVKRILAAVACSAVTGISLAPAATAAVAHPRAGHYAQVSSDGQTFKMEFTVARGMVKDAARYDQCVRVPILMPAVKIQQGRFSYDGTRKDVLSNKFHVHLTGRFVSKTKAKGTWAVKQLTGGDCKSSFSYTVVRQGA
jgi:hypothetical protein